MFLNKPLSEIYRPHNIDDIILNKHMKHKLKELINNKPVVAHLLMYGDAGMGKCFGKDTEFVLSNGTKKKVNELLIGDKLIGSDSNIREIIGLAKGKSEMYKITLPEMRFTYYVNENHLLKLMDDKNEFVISIKDLTDDKINNSFHYKKPIEFKRTELDINIQLLGYWIGFSLNVFDDNFNDENIELSENEDKLTTKMADFIIKYDINNNIRIPDIIKYNDLQTRQEFLNGFLNSYGKKENDVYRVRTNESEFFDDFISMISLMGIYWYYLEDDIGIEINKEAKYFYVVSKEKYDEYYGFTVEGKNGDVLLSNGIITHNTSTALCLAREILGDKIKDGFIEMNASDNRGYEYIYDNIYQFTKQVLHDNEKNKLRKIILLDEADNLTPKAQRLLASIMDIESDKEYGTIFILTCNHINKIIESIQSRCSLLKYNQTNLEVISERLELICKKEKIEFDKEGLDKIVILAKYDIRHSINILESVYYGYKKITLENINRIYNFNQIEEMGLRLYNLMKKKKITETLELLKEIEDEGYYTFDVLNQLTENIKKDKIITKIKQITMLDEVNKTLNDINEMTNMTNNKFYKIQLMNCICSLMS